MVTRRHIVHLHVSRKRFLFNVVFNFQMDLYIHMKGSHIGALNIYQAPVVGFAVKKLSITSDQGQNWFRRQVLFDSDTEFQVRRVKIEELFNALNSSHISALVSTN